MEAATALRPLGVSVLLGRVILDGVVVDDAATADFVRRRMEAGEDPARVVCDAVEVGARVLDSACRTKARTNVARKPPSSHTMPPLRAPTSVRSTPP